MYMSKLSGLSTIISTRYITDGTMGEGYIMSPLASW